MKPIYVAILVFILSALFLHRAYARLFGGSIVVWVAFVLDIIISVLTYLAIR